MDIEKIAAKLRPMMPEKIDRWIKTRQMADPELKILIEKQIIATAYKRFGNFNDKILLSLPPEDKAKGTIQLGTILYDKPRWPMGFQYGELIQNMAILGRSGAGKTNVTFHLLRQLVDKKIPFVFLDWKRTVRHLIPELGDTLNIYTPGRSLSPFPFNPFVVPPGTESNVYAGQVVDVLSEAFTLGDGSRSILRKVIYALYQQGNLSPTVTDIIAELEQFSMPCGGWKVALRALEAWRLHIIRRSIDQHHWRSGCWTTRHRTGCIEPASKQFLIPVMPMAAQCPAEASAGLS